MSRSVHKSNLQFGMVSLPVTVHTGVTMFGLDTHRYHVGCNGSIKQPMFCELHPDMPAPEFFSGLDLGGVVVPMMPEERKDITGSNAPITVVGVYELKHLSTLLASDYQIACSYIMSIDPSVQVPGMALDTIFSTLLDRLRIRKQMVMLHLGISGVERYAFLLPNGRLVTLTYSEENVDLPIRALPKRTYAPEINDLLDSFSQSEFPALSLDTVLSRLSTWVAKKTRKPRRNAKKNATERVPA